MTREEAWKRTKGYLCDVLDGEEADEIIKALEQEPCEDCVSRKEAIKSIKEQFSYGECYCDEYSIVGLMNILPPVTPQEPHTGHWTQTNEFFINRDGQFIYKFICSECKSLSYLRKSNKKAIGANVCPNCGAKMEVEEK